MRLPRRHRRLLLLLCLCSTVGLIWSVSRPSKDQLLPPALPRPPPKPVTLVVDRRAEDDAAYEAAADLREVDWHRRLRAGRQPSEERILVLLETEYSAFGKELREVLDALKFPYKAEVLGRQLPQLTTQQGGKFGLVVVENYYKYLNMDEWQRQLLDKYLREFGVALVSFLKPRADKPYSRAKVKGFPLAIQQNSPVADLRIAPNSSLLRLARPGAVLSASQRRKLSDGWLLFRPEHGSYEPLLLAQPSSSAAWLPAAVFDEGRVDGIARVLFGRDFSAWLVRLLFVDALSALSAFSLPPRRLLQIDIDDIFVGKSGQRMTRADVEGLRRTQALLADDVPGFRFQLGFSGNFYKAGDDLEDQGDQAFLENHWSFDWFGHLWRHQQAPRLNDSQLEVALQANSQWAKAHGLVVNTSYAVAPHHAGVYPVHEPLYSLWRSVWGVRVTSTEEYPHQRPAARRRGFMHRRLAVLPRQTCGLFTKTRTLADHPGGERGLLDSLEGGPLFFTFLLNPYLVFMTHSNNYALERLAPFLFRSQLRFLAAWTRLELGWAPPLEMARAYFDAYPEEREPVWGNPCLDKKHLAIWSEEKSCDRLPQLLILGPQKTGTTALHYFLQLHPSLRPSKPSPSTFEELQFFSNPRLYRNGLDWYMGFFEPSETLLNASAPEVLFEKSATYFDSEGAPKRAAALVPGAKLVAVLTSPALRAHSWYQHERAHGDPTALRHDFGAVLAGLDAAGAPAAKGSDLWRLRSRCLNPGLYARHIERWLEHFSAKQLLLVDGARLREAPAPVLRSLTDFLGLPPFDFGPLLRFDEKKGFFCPVGKPCLGKGKGRVYDPMSEEDRRTLDSIYRPHNIQLHRLLHRLGYPIPSWLKLELQDIVS